MPLSITLEQAQARGIHRYPNGSTMTALFGRFDTEAPGPLAFMVTSPPTYVLDAHMHPTDQFQLFVKGAAKIGRHGAKLGGIHYSDAYTPYGPIISECEGDYGYYTLRPAWSTDTHWIPAEIALAKGRSGRNLTADADLGGARGAVDLIDEPDGVGARVVIAEAGEQVVIPPSPGGFYCVVLEGEVLLDGEAKPPLSCIWSADETISPVAGAEGASLAILRFATPGAERPKQRSGGH